MLYGTLLAWIYFGLHNGEPFIWITINCTDMTVVEVIICFQQFIRLKTLLGMFTAKQVTFCFTGHVDESCWIFEMT